MQLSLHAKPSGAIQLVVFLPGTQECVLSAPGLMRQENQWLHLSRASASQTGHL